MARILFLCLCLATVQGMSILDRREVMRTVFARTQIIVASMIAPPVDDSRLDVVVPAPKRSKEETATLSIPRIGYSLYKTDVAQVERCVQVALDAGVRHFDVGTLYGSNTEVGKVLKEYLYKGLPDQSGMNRKQRREELFVSHKVSNAEQSTNRRAIKNAVKNEMSKLGMTYLDLVSVHSPLTDKRRRLATYEALLDLQRDGVVKAVGVCNYGVNPLNEITDAGLPAPSVIQLVLSPFNQHKDVVAWANDHGSILSCNAWSKLSSVDGPQEGWAVLADIAKSKGMTKSQVMVRWAFQKDYLCVPRSASKVKLERLAISENSYDGVRDFILTPKEMDILNGLDEQLPAGRMGIKDGWSESDIVNAQWDPTAV